MRNRNSIEYIDPNLVDFMLNPDDDKQFKDRTEEEKELLEQEKSEE